MIARRLLPALVLLAGFLPAQFTLSVRDGVLGRSVDLAVTGPPGTRFLLFTSTRPGPIPLALVDPGDPRSLAVGLDLLCCLMNGFILGSGRVAYGLAVPPDPALLGAALRFQALAYPGVTPRLFGPMSHPRGIHVWSPAAFEPLATSLPYPRIFTQGVVLPGGRLFCAGGGTGAMLALISGRQTWFFDPVGRGIVQGPTMTVERGLHTADLLRDGRVLLACGVNYLNDPLDTVEVYDPAKNTCTAIKGKTSHKRSGHTSALLGDGRVLLAGGLSDMNGQLQALGSIVDSTDLFDPAADTITPGPTMAEPRAAHFCLPLPDGRFLLGGGASWRWVVILKVPYLSAATEIYDPKTNKLTPGPSMGTVRGFASAIELRDGRFLVVGGASGNLAQLGAPTASCEIYDPKQNRFTATGSLQQARALAVLALLHDGRVIAAGGSRGDLLNPVSLTTSEIYDPVKGTWSPGPNLPSGRAGCLRAELPDDTVTLFGGVSAGPSGSAQNSMEVFHP